MRLRDMALRTLCARPSVSPRVAAAALALALSPIAHAAQPVPQRGYDASVTGATLAETTLNVANVTSDTFGLVFKLPVDDTVYAQPLYVPNVVIPGQGTHNVVYVATMSDTLYAFDADAGGAALWSVNFASLVNASTAWMANFAFAANQNIVGNLGILSTPVIDGSTDVLYLVACTLESGTLAYRLHAVDITTGTEPFGPGVLIAGSYVSPPPMMVTATFDARYQTQRVSLALSGNQVVFGFGALEAETSSVGSNVGWVMAYNKTTLQQSGAFATVTTGNRGGGVWQSGRPPVVDGAGDVYVFVGNAYGGGYDGVNDFTESVLKLDPANGLKLVDWFTPGNWSTLDDKDQDLSSSGPLLIPGTSPPLLAGGGKTCDLYLLDTTNLGHFNANDSQVDQKQHICSGSFRGGPVYWQRSAANGGPLLYNWGSNGLVTAYAFAGTQIAANPSALGTISQIWPGGILTLSANGEQHGSGILWATVATSGDANDHPPVPGALRALNAENVAASELWDSTMNPTRDDFGDFAKFVPPLVANGKVYVATWSNQLAVYGLLTTNTVSPTSLAFGSQTTNTAGTSKLITVTNTGNEPLPITSITFSATSPHPFSQTNTCGPPVAPGSACTISVVFNPNSAGSKKSTLSVNAAAGAGAQTVALTGTGVAPPYTLSPTSLAFGNQTTNVASAQKMIAVTNTSNTAVPITTVTLSTTSPHPFALNNTCGGFIAANSSCTISVAFDPSSIGAKTAKLSFNAGAAGTQTVTLMGTGIVPPYTVSPATVAFGSQLHGTSSAAQPVTVTNTGSSALPITSIALSNTSPHPFSQTNTCGNSVAVGGSCTISVIFNPTSTGTKTAKLSVNAGGSAGTQTVVLSGTGS